MTQSPDAIGFVGVGRMGANMARRLHNLGFTLSSVYDREGSVAAALADELSCQVAAHPAAVAEASTIIFTVVTDDAAMRQIYALDDPASLLSHAKGRLFINCATISPQVHVEVEKAARKAKAATLVGVRLLYGNRSRAVSVVAAADC